MFLKNINLVNFRNYENISFNFNSGVNIIYGQNAQGKTNLLESIYFLALTKSHRSLNDLNLIRNGENYFLLSSDCKIKDGDTKLEIGFVNNKKKYKKDNVNIKLVSDYISNLKVIIFFPDDLQLIKSSPDVRRHYLNIQISQLDKNYVKILSEYNKLLKIRNNILKNNLVDKKIDINYLNIITNYLIDKAVYIYFYRNKYINKLNNYINNIFYDISGISNFKIVYKNNLNIDNFDIDNIKSFLNNKYNALRDAELHAGSTLFGPHKDEIEFLLDNKNLKLYGSQGQQRLAVLALKLSEIEIFKKYDNDTPILLLDDVFSELDDEKKNYLLKYINNDIQTIITTTELSNLDKKIIDNAKLIHISAGKIMMEDK